MKYIFLTLLVLLFFVSCGPPEFEKNTRILVEGIVIDENSTPVPNASIEIYTERATGVFSKDNFLLGNGLSDENGVFSIISLFDRDEDFQIEVSKQPSFSNYYYILNTKEYPSRDLTYNLGTVTINRLAQINFNITRTSPPNTELQYSFLFQTTDCLEVFNDQGLDIVESNCQEEVSINRRLSENNLEVSGSFTTLLGSNVKFTYQLNDNPETAEIFTIDNENYEFNFSY